MPGISSDLVDRLLFEEEGVALDFKSEQYAFIGASDQSKAELLKDILAFANAWRRSDAYIVLGAKENKGERCSITGLSAHIDDAQIQQFVNSKVQKPIQFSYTALRMEGKDIAVIAIPLQDRPFYLTKNFGGLAADTVYIRRGSSTAIARPDEIAKMGLAEPAQGEIALDIFFADPSTLKRVSPSLKSVVLAVPSKKELPPYNPSRSGTAFSYMSSVNSAYYRELAAFTVVDRLHTPVYLAIANSGGQTAHDVRLEILVSTAGGGISVLDGYDFPSPPQKEFDLHPVAFRREPRRFSVKVDQVEDSRLIRARADKVQPEATVWFKDPVYIGSHQTTRVEFQVTAFADNLSTPHKQLLEIPIEAVKEAADLNRVIELEEQRFAESPGFKKFLRQNGFG